MLCAGSGAAGLQALEQVNARSGQVALVLADLRLPDMTGIEPLSKAHGLDPAAKRALLTGWGDRFGRWAVISYTGAPVQTLGTTVQTDGLCG